ncbi:XkdX family protein [Brevibacillus sp. MCWH]|nr:XkdX family protein [Brevibacillus sp. MCWH]NNV01952.1 XkdX family protein [Brevibacillus sp. MCWH]
MAFWNLAYKYKWVTIEQLRLAVRTESNPYGEITPEEFKQITGQDF